MQQPSLTLTARWIFPADRAPLPRGTVTIEGDRIVAVEPAGARTADEDLGNVAILPGLVNAHTHLDLSDARGKIPPTPDFTAWLRGVIQHRRGQTPEQVERAILAGLVESSRHGVLTLGDISAGGVSASILQARSCWSNVFYETLGLIRGRAQQALAQARFWLQDSLQQAPRFFSEHKQVLSWLPQVSPHAPYSVSRWLFERIAESTGLAGAAGLAIHLAETTAELALLQYREGPLVAFLEELGVWAPDELVPSWDHLIQLFWRRRVLWVHANYLPASTTMGPKHVIVYCPRTHAAFGHAPHPFREFLNRGVRVVLGTDSLASNPDLDILAEARFVHARHPDLPGETLLRMITLEGAIALGWGEVTGSLTPGKSADLVALRLPDRDDSDPYGLIFDATFAVERAMFRGEWRQSPLP